MPIDGQWLLGGPWVYRRVRRPPVRNRILVTERARMFALFAYRERLESGVVAAIVRVSAEEIEGDDVRKDGSLGDGIA